MRPAPVALLLLSVFAGGGLRAAGADQARVCARIPDDTARLACYDAAFARPDAPAPAAGAVSAPPTASTPPAPEFGDRGQLHPEREARNSLPKRVNFKVAKTEVVSGGRFRLTMDNGQVWVTKQSDWALEFKDGDAVTIQRMVAGGFQVSHAGQGRSVTVARIF